jgi:uncharacterized protein YndB with AHSA1/START domain
MNEKEGSFCKTAVLRAPCDKVWCAFSDSQQFGTWFGGEFDHPFVSDTLVTGSMVATKVDA